MSDPFAGLTADTPAAPAPAAQPATGVQPSGSRAGSKLFTLGWPRAIDGVEYREVVIRRRTVADRKRFNAAAPMDAPENVRVLCTTPDGKPLTAETWDNLDADDCDGIVEAAREYLPPEPPRPKFAPGVVASETVKLDFPIEFDGKIYETITVRRLTIGDLTSFVRENGEEPDTGSQFRYPVYFDGAGNRVPWAVLDTLVIVDHRKVVEVTNRFTPPASPAEAG